MFLNSNEQTQPSILTKKQQRRNAELVPNAFYDRIVSKTTFVSTLFPNGAIFVKINADVFLFGDVVST